VTPSGGMARRAGHRPPGGLDIFGYELPAGEGADWATALTEAIAELAGADGCTPRRATAGM
jgi:hypothetical protein